MARKISNNRLRWKDNLTSSLKTKVNLAPNNINRVFPSAIQMSLGMLIETQAWKPEANINARIATNKKNLNKHKAWDLELLQSRLFWTI